MILGRERILPVSVSRLIFIEKKSQPSMEATTAPGIPTATIIALLSTGCGKRVPQASTAEEIQAQARAPIEKALAEDKARVEASPTQPTTVTELSRLRATRER